MATMSNTLSFTLSFPLITNMGVMITLVYSWVMMVKMIIQHTLYMMDTGAAI